MLILVLLPWADGVVLHTVTLGRERVKSYGDRRFSISGPKLWNNLPASLRNDNSLIEFLQKTLKDINLFHQVFFFNL